MKTIPIPYCFWLDETREMKTEANATVSPREICKMDNFSYSIFSNSTLPQKKTSHILQAPLCPQFLCYSQKFVLRYLKKSRTSPKLEQRSKVFTTVNFTWHTSNYGKVHSFDHKMQNPPSVTGPHRTTSVAKRSPILKVHKSLDLKSVNCLCLS